MPAASVAPDSLDPLALFSQDRICLADGDWSMEAVDGLPGAAFFAPPPAGYVPQKYTDASGNAIPDVWGELE
ncbi:unnamed protein product [Timema podura]|uniref:Uncharacterized protein n=1 Tax=Timema podura TaxID=61482 RepID=A0ABN7PMN0_TIMPD|nr:unnamed protein product [Timema podura]